MLNCIFIRNLLILFIFCLSLPVWAVEVDVKLYVNVKLNSLAVDGDANLPNGTQFEIRVRKIEGNTSADDWVDWARSTPIAGAHDVISDKKYKVQWGFKKPLMVGNYLILFEMAESLFQPPQVRKIIGEKGENLEGLGVRRNKTSADFLRLFRFNVAEKPSV